MENIRWIQRGDTPPSLISTGVPVQLTMKVRHGPKLVSGTLKLDPQDVTKGDVQLDHKDSGLAPGQYVVLYDDEEECLGGGVISERQWAKFLLNTERLPLARNESSLVETP